MSSLNVSGNTTLNNATTCISSLNVSGTTTLNGDKLNFPSTLCLVLPQVHYNIQVKVIIHFIIVLIMLIHLQ